MFQNRKNFIKAALLLTRSALFLIFAGNKAAEAKGIRSFAVAQDDKHS